MKEQAIKYDFLPFLNRNYFIASHLAERLDELTGSILFAGVQPEITATVTLLETQIAQIDQVFDILGAVNSFADSEAMVAFLEGIFTKIQNTDNGTPVLSLFDYVSVADALMQESAKLATLPLVQLPQLNTQQHHLHDSAVLEPLKTKLEDACAALLKPSA